MQDRQVVELYENRCCVCYVPLWQERKGRLRRTCSAACRQRLYRMRKGKRERKKKRAAGPTGAAFKRAGTVCPMCGGPMEQPARGRKRKTCSEKCRKRLWRRQNPRCLVCGKHFKMAKYRKEQHYCSEKCKKQAAHYKKQQAKRERAWAEIAWYRPEWLPRKGSGYREETIPWEAGEKEAVVREREPKPNYRPDPEAEEARRKAEEEAAEAEFEAWVAEWKEKTRIEEETRRLTDDLLFDESKWWDWG